MLCVESQKPLGEVTGQTELVVERVNCSWTRSECYQDGDYSVLRGPRASAHAWAPWQQCCREKVTVMDWPHIWRSTEGVLRGTVRYGKSDLAMMKAVCLARDH